MGPSGSDKAPLMHIMGLLGRPAAGTCFVDGRNVPTLDDDERAACRNPDTGVVFRSFRLPEHLTALANVAVPLWCRGRRQREIYRRTRTMLEKAGTAERPDHRPNLLSDGRNQRVAIARALVGEPSVLLANVSIGALDAGNAAVVMRRQVRIGDSRLREAAGGR